MGVSGSCGVGGFFASHWRVVMRAWCGCEV